MVVASFNFPESRLLAEMYAAVLEQQGVRVHREIDLGPRELVTPAMLQGQVDIVPEYLGSALSAIAPDAPPAAATEQALSSLRAALARHGLDALTPADAENQNAVVVTRATAARLRIGTISGLASHAPELVFGGPTECPTRQYCGLGLESTYGITFPEFVALDGVERTRRALEEDVIDVGIMFTTDGHLATGELQVLDDDRHLQPPENVVPVVRSAVIDEYGDRVRTALDAVSARLTTTILRVLNWRVSVGGKDARTEAVAWLVRQGLLPR